MVGPSKSRPPMSHRKTDLGILCRSKICQSSANSNLTWRSASSRRLDAERLGNRGDLRALALDRGGELLCSAAARRLRSRIELVVDLLGVGDRDHVGADALAQVRRQGL